MAAASLALGLWLSPALAIDLIVSGTSGRVSLIEHGQSVPASVGAKLFLPVEIRTGPDGSIDLEQLGSKLHLGPDATMLLPQARDNAVDSIKQSTGTVLYNIKSRKEHPLSVETPYLVSVVKGTLFTVAVEEHAATVALMEGSLDISAPGVTNHVLLKPNQSIRHAEGESQLTLHSSTPAAAIPHNGLRTDTPSASPDTVQPGQMAQVARDLSDAGAAVAAGHRVATHQGSATNAATGSGMTSSPPGAPGSPDGTGSTTGATSSSPSNSPTAGDSSGIGSSSGSTNQGRSSSPGGSPVTLPSGGADTGNNHNGNCNGKNNGTGNGNCLGHQPRQAPKP
jgi:hypothetical protein